MTEQRFGRSRRDFMWVAVTAASTASLPWLGAGEAHARGATSAASCRIGSSSERSGLGSGTDFTSGCDPRHQRCDVERIIKCLVMRLRP